MIIFQLAVARRPLQQLWVRDAGAFKLDGMGVVLVALLLVLPTFLLVRYRHSLGTHLFVFPPMVGAVPAAFALRQQKGKSLLQALPWFAVALVIGLGVFALDAMHDGRPITFSSSKIPLLFAQLLMGFSALFVLEEVVFRGAIDPHLVAGSPGGASKWSAVFGSALWGLWHFQTLHSSNAHDYLVTFLFEIALGIPLVFCWRRSGTLVLPAIAHALIDSYRNMIGGG
jgi:hypothetical protein